MSKFYQETVNTLSNYFANSTDRNVFQDAQGKTATFLYQLDAGPESSTAQKYHVHLRVDHNLEFVIMDVYPGIRITPANAAAIAGVCQRTALPMGSFHCDLDQWALYYHVESSIMDAVATEKTLLHLEAAARASLFRYGAFLDAWANGRVVAEMFRPDFAKDANEHILAAILQETPQSEYVVQSKESLVQYIKNESKHAHAANNLNEESDFVGYSQVRTKDGIFLIEYHLDAVRNRFAILAYPDTFGLRAPAGGMQALEECCARKTDSYKVGSLFYCLEKGCIAVKLESFFVDAALSTESISTIEQIAVSSMMNSREEILQVLQSKQEDDDGEDDRKEKVKKMLDGLQGMLKLPDTGDDDDDDDDDDDGNDGDDDGNDGESFLQMLQRLGLDDDDDDDDDDEQGA